MKTGKFLIWIFIFWTAAYSQTYKPPTKSAQAVENLDFAKAKNIDNDYKKSFDNCDKPGKKCHDDPNNVKALLRFGDDAVFFDSKMSLDLDGSFVGCNCGNNMGSSDQCSTSYFWTIFPNDYDSTAKKDRCKFYEKQFFVDSNEIPYIVIPNKFQNHFKINKTPYNFVTATGADFGVVIYNGKIVPVMVADQGPSFRIGEGSAALLRAAGQERCVKFDGKQCVKYLDRSADENALYFVFPNSSIGKNNFNNKNALELIKQEALKNFEALKTKYKKQS